MTADFQIPPVGWDGLSAAPATAGLDERGCAEPKISSYAYIMAATVRGAVNRNPMKQRAQPATFIRNRTSENPKNFHQCRVITLRLNCMAGQKSSPLSITSGNANFHATRR